MGDMNDICKHDDFEAYCPLCREELRSEVETLRQRVRELESECTAERQRGMIAFRQSQVWQEELATLRKRIADAPVVAYGHHVSDNDDIERFVVDFEPSHCMSVYNGDFPLISKEDLL